MKPTSPKDIQKALASRLARRKISDDVVEKISHRVAQNGLQVGSMNFCPYGICIDYFTDTKISLDELISVEKFRAIKMFPYGILVDDLFRVQVEMHIPELAEHELFG